MAISALQKLSAQIHRLPLHHSKSLISRSSATSASAKVADRLVKLSAIVIDSKMREIIGLAGHTLLKALANSGLIDPASRRLEEIDACPAECKVNIAEEISKFHMLFLALKLLAEIAFQFYEERE